MVKIQIPQHHDHHTLTREVGAKGGGRGCWDGNGESHWGAELGGGSRERAIAFQLLEIFLVQLWEFF